MATIYKNERSKAGDPDHTAFLAIPVYGEIKATCISSLWACQVALRAANIEVDFCILSGCCHVDDARNYLIREFLEGDADQLVFIDADIGFDPVDLVKLIRNKHAVVGGTYPLKQSEEDYPVRYVYDDDGKFESDEDGLIEVEGLPGGFLKIRRHVLEELSEESINYLSRKDDPDRTRIPIIFERTYKDGIRWSGDYTFCRKWSENGGRLYVDPSFSFEHAGSSVWKGRLDSFIRRTSRIAIKNLIGAIIEEKVETQHIIDALSEWGNDIFAGDTEFQATAILMARNATGNIIEAGSGLSTILMAAANQNIKITSFENDSRWFMKCQETLIEFGIKNVDLQYAPLMDYGKFMWYNATIMPGKLCDLFVCDGPPRGVKGKRLGSELWIPLAKKVLFHDAEDRYLQMILEKHCSDLEYLGIRKNTAVGVVMKNKQS